MKHTRELWIAEKTLVTVPAFVVNEYNQLKLENIALKAKVAELEKENERLRGIVHNLDHRLITNGEWSKVWMGRLILMVV